jgi:hypothetical protein
MMAALTAPLIPTTTGMNSAFGRLEGVVGGGGLALPLFASLWNDASSTAIVSPAIVRI